GICSPYKNRARALYQWGNRRGYAALKIYKPSEGDRVLDIGCGFGDTTQRLAGLVGPEGTAGGNCPLLDVDRRRASAEAAELDQPTALTTWRPCRLPSRATSSRSSCTSLP